VSVRKDSLRGLASQLWKMRRGIRHFQEGGSIFLQYIRSFNCYVVQRTKRRPLVSQELPWEHGNIIV